MQDAKESLRRAIQMEIELMGAWADSTEVSTFHSPRKMMEVALEYFDLRDYDACISYVDKVRLSFWGVKGTLVIQMSLIELGWRLEKEIKFC